MTERSSKSAIEDVVSDAAHYSVDDLLAIEAQLDRSFMVCVVALLANLAVPFAVDAPHPRGIAFLLASLASLFATYIWFAVSVGRAEKAVGDNATLFVFWVLAAPLLSLVPIPLVSTILMASPLSLKILLSRELRAKIHEKTFAG